jgi:DNA mismatch repair protein MutL
VTGYVGPTNVHRANRGYITIFVNGRWIEDLRLTYAVIQAYHTLLPVKRYPVAFVMVELPSEDVDVNVHPTKSEVRFRDGDAVFRAVQRAVRATVVGEAPAASTWSPSRPSRDETTGDPSARQRLTALQPAQQHIRFEAGASDGSGAPALGAGSRTRGTAPSPQVAPTGRRGASALPPLRVVGQMATMFVVAEGPDGLYLIDQHAAHERILYDQMLSQAAAGNVPSQPLLEPEVVALPPDEADRLEAYLPALSNLGFEVEAFGPNTFLVRAVPARLQHVASGDLIADIAASEAAGDVVEQAQEEAAIRRICKRAAVKAGQVLAHEEMNRLIRDLEATENPRTCPHGRPTVVQIDTDELARHFGRSGAG